jgi:hypothetical protein
MWVNAHFDREVCMGEEMAVLPVHGDEIVRTRKRQKRLQLTLFRVTTFMDVRDP